MTHPVFHHPRLPMPARRSFCTAVAVVAAACGLAIAAPARAMPVDSSVVSMAVSFSVVNHNTSGMPCAADGARYTVRGHLIGPRPLLTTRPDAITVYLHGLDGGEWNWTFDAVPGYDYATRIGRAGHASLTLDELGYGASGHPADGNLTCVGAQADTVHQIIQQLRGGTYTSDAGLAPRFTRAVLAGHDVGGLIAELEASAYTDIDALIEVTWSDQGHSPFIVERSSTASVAWCTTGSGGTPAPTSYVHYATEADWHSWMFHDADPAVVAATDELRNPNPCGVIRSLAPAAVFENPYSLKAAAGLDPGNAPASRLARVTVPVLVVFGADDTQLWSRQGEDEQAANFLGSRDKTTAYIPGASHFPMFEKSAPQFVHVMSSWLTAHRA